MKLVLNKKKTMAWQMINANIDGQIIGTKYFGHRPINMQQTRNGQNKILEDFLKLGVWFRGHMTIFDNFLFGIVMFGK